MSKLSRAMRLYSLFERAITVTLLILLVIVVLNGTVQMAFEIFRRIWHIASGNPLGLESAREFLKEFAMLREVFGAFLLILIGVELMRTVVIYLEEHELHVEVVFTVAMIAIARHAIDVDVAHASPMLLIAMGVVILALTAAYYLYRRAGSSPRGSGPAEPGRD
jgi:uncharacterized membrane protein (DUF373 family)